jgi:ABC-3C protein
MREYRRRLLALDDAELEHFVRDWVALKKNDYFEVKPYSGPQDLGRDVVGFLTKKRHEGPWHNYQCKQYTRRRLPLGNGLAELGKILYHAHTGAFTTPAGYHFVAPYGVSRDLEGLIDKPESLREALIDGWDQYCGTSIVRGKTIPLDAKLRALIEGYDFSLVTRISLEEMLAVENVLLVLHRHLGSDPGPAPQTPAPEKVQEKELGYITELMGAYGARDGVTYNGHEDIASHAEHGEHFKRQRERFFDADGFKRFYRDNTAKETLPALEKDIHNGIIETRNLHYEDALRRHDAVMQEAGKLVLSAPLGPHARVTVKQGYCHHLVNDGKMTWRKK